MTDLQEKGSGYNSGSSDGNRSQEQVVLFERPKGLKGFYYHPLTQVVLLGFVCFMCPGLFNALNGLGGGGQIDATTSANANAALYATFAFGAFFSGSITNKLGSRLTLFLGSTGYPLYIGAYLALNIHPHAGAFLIAAGAILGICAGLLWSAQGSLMLGYATEGQKGKFIAVFWAVFNTGAVVGAAVSLGQNIHSTTNSVSNSTYIAFLVLTIVGMIITTLMADPAKVIRTDGTKVEIYGLWITLLTDPMVILLFPMFLASNWFYTWQFNDYNDAIFNIRARSLNNLVYWLAQSVGAIAMGTLLDQKALTRRLRAFSGWAVLFCMVWIVHIWAYFYQKTYTRESVPPDSDNKIDISDSGYAAKIWLYIFCGLLDAMWQTASYWILGAMSNDPAKLAYFAGFYKSIQSAGAAGAWRADAVKTPYMNLFISTWVLLVAGLVFALPMLYLRVKEHTDLADETLLRMDDAGNILDTAQVARERPDLVSEK
ncbi:major facilitator superfamily domain-containing protein [Gymnopilus junonius]|uniref:Major facilitator superfamily domain-containing protein n=1 Tax=Gymnopilus junonius TaxID=109634 RepID=A0A9P5NW62_GYMJU|nr:major facilitator superfamily domain-containing protein [Gymnopilus junonius]